jgi:hypothetical protein
LLSEGAGVAGAGVVAIGVVEVFGALLSEGVVSVPGVAGAVTAGVEEVLVLLLDGVLGCPAKTK